MDNPFDEQERARRNAEARTKTQEVTDLARIILGADADPRDIERTALAFATLPKNIIVHARKAVQKAMGGPPSEPTPPSAHEVVEAILAHPGLVHGLLHHLHTVDKKALGASAWHSDKSGKHWSRDCAWPDAPPVAETRQVSAGSWAWKTELTWETSMSPTGVRSGQKAGGSGKANSLEEALAAADKHLAEQGWVLL